MTTPPLRKLWKKDLAAEQISVSPRTLDRLISEGEIESVLIGRSRLVPDDALDDYIARVRKAS